MTSRGEGPLARRWGLAAIGGVLALVLGAVVLVQGRQLALAQQALRSGDGYSVTSLFQLEVETLRLRDQWRTVLEAATPEALDSLRLRYEIWVSRIDLARAPSLQAMMAGEPDYAAAVSQLGSFVADTDRLLAADEAPDPAALQAAFEQFNGLVTPVHGLSLAAAHRLAQRADDGNRALQQQSRLGVALSVFLFALCAVFAGLAMRQMRQLQQRRLALEDLTERLREARGDAEAASEAKSAFLANMSHEIRTPFQGLLGMLSLLRESGLTPRQAEHLRVATESADHLLAILNDILDMSQLESGRLTLNPAPLDLRALLTQTDNLMRTQAAAKSLALYLDVAPDVPEWVVADATRLKQILFNLLSNAIKFCERGSVAMDVRVLSGPPERLAFVVTDTGVGMDAQTVQRLFRRFAPGDPTLQRRHGGAGLGLEISRNLARMMGGDITVHSVPGEGSRFCLDLPLQRHQAPLPAPPSALTPDQPLRTLEILVAEDHPVNRQYLASLLETLHHKAHFVPDGRQAVQAVQQRRFDLVLMDLHMPELDGIGATVAIRALPDRAAATVPIVALTADAFQETRERCLLAGMNDFLTKPVSPQGLATALRRLFGRVASDGPPAPAPTVAPLPSEAELIDPAAVAAALQGLSHERLATLITSFLDQGGQTVAHMRAAVRSGQPLELRVHAHAARGAALNLGLAALAQTAQALHEGAAHLPAHEVAHLVQRYESQLARTRQAARDAGLLSPA
ncbi:response regulator [Rubrivivax albus]|uniref:Sensory/regulatory protein RpfC n=1 Tax=Rubrivivax albus TaxID=2499835 RepID=A0A3S2TPT7_9BURK|nr:response regulator [Rubrivivax albus]RVT53925.1 response regulator [Rubrivivax albus]